jgi:hypothetical protein
LFGRMRGMNIIRARLFSHMTKTRFLHIEDSLTQGKLRFFVGSFERGQGANQVAHAFIDVEDARVILSDLSWGKKVDFTDYKGGKDNIGAVISRVLKIQTKEDKIWIEVQNGQGEEPSEGAVKPKGKLFAEIPVPLTLFESRKMAMACLAYLQAWDVWKMLNVTPACAQCPARAKLPLGNGQ